MSICPLVISARSVHSRDFRQSDASASPDTAMGAHDVGVTTVGVNPAGGTNPAGVDLTHKSQTRFCLSCGLRLSSNKQHATQ